ncbi:MAG: dihydroorotase, partial [Pseudomonadota bacterium]
MKSFSLAGGRILDPVSGRDEVADLHLVDGQLSESAAPGADLIDVSGKWVLPGLVDLHGRLAPSGRSITGRLGELQLAAQCGITSLCVGPDTNPVLDSVAALEQLSLLTDRVEGCRTHPIGALTQGLAGEHLAEIATLSESGCVAFSDLNLRSQDARVLLRAMRYARNFDLTIMVQPCDPKLAADGCVHEGPLAHRLGLPGVPSCAESVAVGLWLELCRDAGTQLHFNKLSTARGVDLIRAAKSEGLPVTADTSITHTRFDSNALAGFNNRFNVWPPLRDAEDREALCK